MMNVSLPDSLKPFVEEQVSEHGYASTSDYVTGVIQREQERAHLRRLLLEGAASPPGPVADHTYFESLRQELRERHRA